MVSVLFDTRAQQKEFVSMDSYNPQLTTLIYLHATKWDRRIIDGAAFDLPAYYRSAGLAHLIIRMNAGLTGMNIRVPDYMAERYFLSQPDGPDPDAYRGVLETGMKQYNPAFYRFIDDQVGIASLGLEQIMGMADIAIPIGMAAGYGSGISGEDGTGPNLDYYLYFDDS
ncbi:hypothetical protein A2Z33_04415 [Candidatus Gottesmanbacteria bacterium RBG_16_52_11]|uniref:Uncharacterized protein n=1 Tax=Candidatus Gottesmanbacteria bacterium RBG_16_52_11 TaxID=1798374 RepID=A0A1F5YW83_9BACT|nr:MAG: hypothetical protein A2Z33_04415 [Candidatus Gottesmanbacteria bacterium RBG_16_52_11]